MGKAGEVEPSPLTFPAGPWALPHPHLGWGCNLWPHLHCPRCQRLTMAAVPQYVLPVWGPLAGGLQRPECRPWEPQMGLTCQQPQGEVTGRGQLGVGGSHSPGAGRPSPRAPRLQSESGR